MTRKSGSTKAPGARDAVILALLARRERYGLEIAEAFHGATGGAIPRGSLYGTLHRLEERGLIRGHRGRAKRSSGGNRRMYFALTASGRRALAATQKWIGQMKKALGGTKRRARR